jgi:hypothetical protein
MSKESKFQKDLIEEIKERFPGSMVLKNDSHYIQGIPDLTVFYKKHWATLECKKSKDEHHQPNQDGYVDKMNEMSFSSFIYPENKGEVLDAMERSFKVRRASRSPKSK